MKGGREGELHCRVRGWARSLVAGSPQQLMRGISGRDASALAYPLCSTACNGPALKSALQVGKVHTKWVKFIKGKPPRAAVPLRRTFLANPDLPKRFLLSAPLNKVQAQAAATIHIAAAAAAPADSDPATTQCSCTCAARCKRWWRAACPLWQHPLPACGPPCSPAPPPITPEPLPFTLPLHLQYDRTTFYSQGEEGE